MAFNIDDFKQIFDATTPDEYHEQLVEAERYISRLSDELYRQYTYCTGCRKLVKKDACYREPTTNTQHILTRCNQCHTIWFISNS